MRPIHHLLLTCLLAFGILAGEVRAADPAPPAPPAPVAPVAPAVKNPLEDETPNPLTEPDPFAGEYEGEEVIVIIKVSGDGYGGEIRRAGRTFPIKATRDGKVVTGTFSHESTTFKFTAQFEGQALKLASGNKTFLLKRKDAAAATAPPAPTPTRNAALHAASITALCRDMPR